MGERAPEAGRQTGQSRLYYIMTNVHRLQSYFMFDAQAFIFSFQ
jgi:hypothetical protein